MDDEQALLRALVFGTTRTTKCATGGTRSPLWLVDHVSTMLSKNKGDEVIGLILRVAHSPKSPDPKNAIEALAVCVAYGEARTVTKAYSALNDCCRTPTHLFYFLHVCDAVWKARDQLGKGWGRARRTAIARWYTSRSPDALALAVTKYKQRHERTHAQVLKKAHVKVCKYVPAQQQHDYNMVLRYALVGLTNEHESCTPQLVKYLQDVETVKTADAFTCCEIIRANPGTICREHMRSDLLTNISVCTALLEHMPAHALLRQLGPMTKLHVLTPGAAITQHVCDKLTGNGSLRKVHPIEVLKAKLQYDRGQSLKGSSKWEPVPAISRALDTAFNLAMDIVEPDDLREWEVVNEGVPPCAKRHICVAVDITGSMAWTPVCGAEALSARVAAGCLAYVTNKKLPDECVTTVGFGTSVQEFGQLDAFESLDKALDAMKTLNDRLLEIVIVLDCTASMGPSMRTVKNSLLELTKKLQCYFVNGAGDNLLIGFVGYRDHHDTTPLVKFPLTSNVNRLQQLIQKLKPEGGGDEPENVAGGFAAAAEMFGTHGNDSTAVQLLVHIADAPCHGTQYHDLNYSEDNFPQGDPLGRDPCDQLEAFAKRGISYLFCDATPLDREPLNKRMIDRFVNVYAQHAAQPLVHVRLIDNQLDRSLQAAVLASVELAAAGGGTDSAAPLQWALNLRKKYDGFVIYTDNETSSCMEEVLRDYRATVNADVRVAVVSLAPLDNAEPYFSHCDDPNVMEFVGFDSSTPDKLESFISGKV